MKKILCFCLLILVLCFAFYGCANNAQVFTPSEPNNIIQNNPNNTTQNIQDKEEPKVVNLTVANIEEFLMFRSEVNDAHIWGNIGGKERCNAEFTIITACKQNVEFKNLKIKFTIVPTSATKGVGWDTIYIYDNGYKNFEPILDIPYNGVWEETYEITSEHKSYVSDDPHFEIVITSVSGQAVFN